MADPMEEARKLGLQPVAAAPAAAPDPMEEARKMGLVEGPGMVTSLLRGGVQGVTLNYADEAGGALQAAIDKITGNGGNRSLAELYRIRRDQLRAADQRAKEANPGTYFLGELGGGALIPVPGGGLVKTAATMAGMGAVAAAGANEDINTLGRDIVGGAAGGAVAGAAGYGLGKVATSRPVTDLLDRAGIRAGRTHLAGHTTPFAGGNIHEPISEEAIRAAHEVGAFRGRSVRSSEEVLRGKMTEAGNEVQRVVGQLTKDKGVRGMDIETLATKLEAMADDIQSKTLGDPRPKLLREHAKELREKLDPEGLAAAYQKNYGEVEAGLRKSYGDLFWNERTPEQRDFFVKQHLQSRGITEPELPTDLPLAQTEGIKSSAQDMGRYEKLAPDLKMAVERDIGRIIKEGNEAAVGAQAGKGALNKFRAAKDRFGPLAEAHDAAVKGTAMMENRPPYGITELAAVATGHLPVGIGTYLAKTRGYGAAASGLLSSAAKLRAIAHSAPNTLGKYAGVFQRAANDEEAAKTHFVLNSTDHVYRQTVGKALNKDHGDGGQ